MVGRALEKAVGWAWPQTQPDAARVPREPEEGRISGTVVPSDSSSQEGVHPGSSAPQARVVLGGSHLSRTRSSHKYGPEGS